MLLKLVTLLIVCNVGQVSCFWDMGTTTDPGPSRDDETPRTSFFRWQWVFDNFWSFWYFYWDWEDIERRRKLNVVCGLSIDLIPLSTGTILNRRVIVTSYNYLDPYMNRQRQMRIWTLGRQGVHNTPYRYRVYVVHRVIPLSINDENCHGPRCTHHPRHDVSVVIALDQMYVYLIPPTRYAYAYRAFLPPKFHILREYIWMAGSGYEYMEHVLENYKIFFYIMHKEDIVDCSNFLPKWWGKYICIKNIKGFPGVQNGGPFFSDSYLVGLGCFEIRYNEDRIFVFTDLRYYYTKIEGFAYLKPGQYYEYAYAQWSLILGWLWDSMSRDAYIPAWQLTYDQYPLG